MILDYSTDRLKVLLQRIQEELIRRGEGIPSNLWEERRMSCHCTDEDVNCWCDLE